MVVERLQIAVRKGKEPDIHLALIALLALALQVHRHFGGDEGLEIVRGLQRLQLHIVIHHQQLVLQIGAGEGAALHLGDAAVFQVAAEHFLHHHADAALALAVVALEQHHHLPAVCRNQAVAEVFLQGQDVLRFQQVRQNRSQVSGCGALGSYRMGSRLRQNSFSVRNAPLRNSVPLAT